MRFQNLLALLALSGVFARVAAAKPPDDHHPDEHRRAEHSHDRDSPQAAGAEHAAFKARRELEEKQRAGALSVAEKQRLAQLQAERQKRYATLDQSDKVKAESRAQRRNESERQAQERYQAVAHDPAAQQEFDQNAERVAKLDRAREVAAAEGRDDVVARVDQLLSKEKQRHETWLAAHK